MTALLLSLLLAQSHPWPAQDNASQEEKCKDDCRKQHCDSWLFCNEITDPNDREACKDRTSDDEQRCKKLCGEPKT